MKKLINIFLLFPVIAFSQQQPQYTQYVLNQYILNPALSGIESYTDLKLSARDQWVGINGAPRTAYLTIHAPIGKASHEATATSFGTPGQNPMGKAYWENYTAAPAHHGIGLNIVNYKTGLYNRFSAAATYAYHIGLSPKTNLALGFSGGFNKLGYRVSDANPGEPLDPALGAGDKTIYKMNPDLGAGLWLYAADYFVGLSAQQLIPQRVKFTGQTSGFDLVPHFFATAGYRVLLNEDLNLLPSVMLKFVNHSPTKPQADVNLKLQYHDLLWVGGSFRQGNGYSAMMGMHLGSSFTFGYAYDFTTSLLNTQSRGSHEFVMGFLIGNRYGDGCPRNVW